MSSGNISRRGFVAGLAACAAMNYSLPLAFAKKEVKPFSFVYICNSHLTTGQPDSGYKLLQESQLFLQESLKAVNRLNPDFVIFGGDQVEQLGGNETNWQLFVDLAQSLNAPWCFVLGEQDIAGKAAVNKMHAFGPDWKGKGLTGNTPYWSMNPADGLHFIGLDSSMPNSSKGEISREQLEWLKNDLENNKENLTIIFCHHPLLPPPPYDGGPPWDEFALDNGSDVREIIGSYGNVRLVVSGHLYLNKIQLERNTYHVSCAGMDVYPCQYKLFKITSDAISVESIPVEFPALIKKGYKSLITSNLAFKYDQRHPAKIAELAEGGKEDQNALLSLKETTKPQPVSRKRSMWKKTK